MSGPFQVDARLRISQSEQGGLPGFRGAGHRPIEARIPILGAPAYLPFSMSLPSRVPISAASRYCGMGFSRYTPLLANRNEVAILPSRPPPLRNESGWALYRCPYPLKGPLIQMRPRALPLPPSARTSGSALYVPSSGSSVSRAVFFPQALHSFDTLQQIVLWTLAAYIAPDDVGMSILVNRSFTLLPC